MSIATLKKKTQAKYNNNSVGYHNFSINGTTRNQGFVGQTSLSRSLIKTPMRGTTPQGYGGCCGKYRQSIVFPSGIQYFNNNSYIKPSVLSNSGQIATQYRWIRRPAPFSTVKPDNNLVLNHSQGSYISNLDRKTINGINAGNAKLNAPLGTADNNATVVNSPYIYSYTNYQHKALCPAITKTVAGTMSESEYLLQLDSGCTNDANVPFAVQRAPFAGMTAN